MKTDYFNLIESKVNTAEIIKKKISKILDNQQTGGVHFGHMAAKFAANKLATSPMAQNAMNDGAISMGQNAMNSVGETDKKKNKAEKGKDKENDKHKKEEDKENKKQKQKQKDKLLKKIKPNTQISPDYPQLQVIPRNPHIVGNLHRGKSPWGFLLEATPWPKGNPHRGNSWRFPMGITHGGSPWRFPISP